VLFTISTAFDQRLFDYRLIEEDTDQLIVNQLVKRNERWINPLIETVLKKTVRSSSPPSTAECGNPA